MCIFGEGQKNLAFFLRLFWRGPETRRAAPAEAEHTPTAGRRLKTEAVSGSQAEQGWFPNCQTETSAEKPREIPFPDHFREAYLSVLVDASVSDLAICHQLT